MCRDAWDMSCESDEAFVYLRIYKYEQALTSSAHIVSDFIIEEETFFPMKIYLFY